MGQTQGKRIFTRDHSLSKEEHRQRLQQHRWRAEVGPEDAPANRPPPPFSLRAMTVAEFVKAQKELIVVPSTSTVEGMLAILNDHKIHSAPIMDQADNTFLGVLSLNDLTSFLLSHHGVDSDRPTEQALQTVVSSIVGLYDAQDTVKVHKTDTLRDVVKKMKHHRVHRLLVEDINGKVVAVISQMGLLRLLYENMDDLFDDPDATLHDLGMASKPVKTVHEDGTALDALFTLRDCRYGALGVVDSKGALVGELNMSDVREIDEERHKQLGDMTVADFMSSQALCTCTKLTTLRSVVAQLHETRHYRTFVVDENKKPLGIVTLTDCLDHITRR